MKKKHIAFLVGFLFLLGCQKREDISNLESYQDLSRGEKIQIYAIMPIHDGRTENEIAGNEIKGNATLNFKAEVVSITPDKLTVLLFSEEKSEYTDSVTYLGRYIRRIERIKNENHNQSEQDNPITRP